MCLAACFSWVREAVTADQSIVTLQQLLNLVVIFVWERKVFMPHGKFGGEPNPSGLLNGSGWVESLSCHSNSRGNCRVQTEMAEGRENMEGS